MTSAEAYEKWQGFAALFGYPADDETVTAFGTGKGQWIKRPLRPDDWIDHLRGDGPGVGIPPLRRDGTVWFAAIDLDEPDFEAAKMMQDFIPGTSWIERSRSGNAHVWVFFTEPIEAWVVRGILKEAILAAGKGAVEVFPKQDQLREDMLGNYINLPYHGDTRPILHRLSDFSKSGPGAHEVALDNFVAAAEDARNEPADWHKRARWLMIVPPELREKSAQEFGSKKELHMCAEWMLANRDENPVVEGHRNAVFFALAKQLSNYEGFDHDEVWMLMQQMNEASPDRAPDSELKRILHNAERGQYTSTDCDNPLVTPYCHPDCPIANQR
jgi:hypothetical protein